MLKKVVVVYPYRGKRGRDIILSAEKTFEGDLEVLNKDSGVLVIKEVNGHEHAVFKEWIYWENLE